MGAVRDWPFRMLTMEIIVFIPYSMADTALGFDRDYITYWGKWR